MSHCSARANPAVFSCWDFPISRGSAYVGILDAFWESKGLVTPEKFRESCAPTVLLARMPKRTYNNNENFEVRLEVYHYGQQPIRKGNWNGHWSAKRARLSAKGA